VCAAERAFHFEDEGRYANQFGEEKADIDPERGLGRAAIEKF